MNINDLMEMIDEEYGHAYFPEFYDWDTKTVAKMWLQHAEGARELTDVYYQGKVPTGSKLAIDMQDHIGDWIDAQYDKWKEYN